MVERGRGAKEPEYDLLDELERLESLAEEMEELGVTSLAEVRRRIVEVNARLEEAETRGEDEK